MYCRPLSLLFFILLLFSAQPSLALQPEEILLIVNRNVPAGLELARYYQKQRQIPAANLLSVDLPDQEDFSREDYLQKLISPLRAYLAAHEGPQIRCLLLFYGLPLRIAAPELSQGQWQLQEEYKYKKKQLDWQIREHAEAADAAQWRSESEQLGKQIAMLGGRERGAALDSEVALVLNDNWLVSRICGDTQVPVTCQVRDIRRFVSILGF